MGNEISTNFSEKTVRNGITEGQWATLEPPQKYNWRVALFFIVAVSYLTLHVASADLLSLGGLPKWVFHVIGMYSSCCFLLLIAGERAYSLLSERQRNVIDTVWAIGGSLLFLTGGVLFVLFISSVILLGVIPILADTFPEVLGLEWVGTVLLSLILVVVIYIRFKSFLIECFRLPRMVGQYWKFADRTGSVMPLAKMEFSLAVAFSVGHIVVSCMLSSLFSVWS